MTHLTEERVEEPMASKADLMADIEATINEIQVHTLPRFQGTIESKLYIKGYRLEAAWTQKRARLYQTNVRGAGSQFIEHVSEMLSVSLKWLTYIYDALEKQLEGKEVTVDGVSYPVKTLLDVYSVLKIHVRMSRKLLLLVYSFESDDVESNQPGKPNFPYTRAEVMQLENNFAIYCRIANMLDKNRRNSLERIVKAIPDVDVDTDGTANAVYGQTKLSPLTNGITEFGRIPNLIWTVRRWFASWQADQFKAAEAEAKMLELRLIRMRRQAEGEHDAQLDKSIEYQTKRLTELNYRIHVMEQKYGL